MEGHERDGGAVADVDGSGAASVIGEILESLVHEAAASTVDHDESAVERLSGDLVDEAVAWQAGHGESDLGEVLARLVDDAVASSDQGRQISGRDEALAGLLRRFAASVPKSHEQQAIVISSDEDESEREPLAQIITRRGRAGGRDRGTSSPAAAAAAAGVCDRCISAVDTTTVVGRRTKDDGRDVVARIQQRPAVNFPRHAFRKRRYDHPSPDEGDGGEIDKPNNNNNNNNNNNSSSSSSKKKKKKKTTNTAVAVAAAAGSAKLVNGERDRTGRIGAAARNSTKRWRY